MSAHVLLTRYKVLFYRKSSTSEVKKRSANDKLKNGLPLPLIFIADQELTEMMPAAPGCAINRAGL